MVALFDKKGLEELEKKEKLSRIERFAINQFIKKGLRMIKKMEKLSKDQKRAEEYKLKLIRSIMETTDILEVYTDEDKLVTRADLEVMEVKELANLLIDIIKEMREKIR